MPSHPADPVPVEEMEREGGYITICETIRKIYWAIDGDQNKEDAKLNCRIALAMAKRMQAKLVWYKHRSNE